MLIAKGFGTSHAALYAVLMASSSAALILPIIDSLGLGGAKVVQLLPQVAIADAACFIALPLAIDPAHAGRAGLGALAVLLSAAQSSSYSAPWSAEGCDDDSTACPRHVTSPLSFG